MENSWCPYPSLVGVERLVKDTFIPLWREVLEGIWPSGKLAQGPSERSVRLWEVPLTGGLR